MATRKQPGRIFNTSWESAMTFKGKSKKLFPELTDIENGVKRGGAFGGAVNG